MSTVQEVARAQAELTGANPEEVLSWGLARFGRRLMVSTAFGAEGCALVDMAVRLDPQVRVFTVDTGYLFAETRALIDAFRTRYGLRLYVAQPKLTVEQQNAQWGERLFGRDPDQCCALRKVAPLQQALAGADGWVAGLRRDQSASRATIDTVERFVLQTGRSIIKLHPLAHWTRQQVWQYIADNDVPYNPLLDQGYPSIGCWPCTKRVSVGGKERDGRWAGTSKSECGIHVSLPLRKVGS